MTVPTPIFRPGTVLVLPFPFTDRQASKRRPAVVVSGAGFNTRAGHFVAAMITSADHRPWPEDVSITQLAATGLPHPSVVRMKLFTLDERLVLRSSGALAAPDWFAVSRALASVFPDAHARSTAVHEPQPTYGT